MFKIGNMYDSSTKKIYSSKFRRRSHTYALKDFKNNIHTLNFGEGATALSTMLREDQTKREFYIAYFL